MERPTSAAMRSTRLIPALGLMGFLLFGMRDGAVGVAWPSIRATFGQPLSALGLLVLASLIGYLVTSATSGRVGLLLPVGWQLVVASLSASAGVATFALSTHWLLLVGASALLGAANGIVDVNVNAHLATHHRVGTMNLVHAGWGLGTTAGPLVVTASLALEGSWRPAYLLLLAFELILLAGFVSTRTRWEAPAARGAPATADTPTARRASRVTLAATLTLFFAYAGLELGTGQWAYTFLVSGHAVAPTPAGLAVAVYWGALTGARVVASILGERLRPMALLDVCLGVTLAGCLLVFWYPGTLGAALGLAVTGLGLGPVFPTLVALTPARVGARRTSAVMGYQLSAAALGGALLSAAIGVALQQFGPRALGSIVVVGVGVLIGVRSMTRRLEAA